MKTHGSYWGEENQGKVARVVKVPASDILTVKWEENLKRRGGKGNRKNALAGSVAQYKLGEKSVYGKLVFAFLCS